MRLRWAFDSCSALSLLQHAKILGFLSILIFLSCISCWLPAECRALEQAGHGKTTSLLVQHARPSLK